MKRDWDTVVEGVQKGIGDITKGKEDVEEIHKDAEGLYEGFTGDPADAPRYDSAWVAEIQQRLTATGLNPGPVDGAFGKKTGAAIVAFQNSIGIAADGLPRPSMMRALRARTQTMVAGATPQTGPAAAAPAGGSLAGAPAWPASESPASESPAWPAPATGGGLIAPAPSGLATQGGQIAAAPSGGAGGGLVAPAPGVAARTEGAAPAPAAAGASPASPENAALIGQLGLRTALGRPVVADFVAKNRGAITDAEEEALQRFFDLVLLTLNPDALDGSAIAQQRPLCLANRFLSEAQKDQVLNPVDPRRSLNGFRDWKGAGRNELEAGRARQQFLDGYLPQIVAAGPQFPIEFIFIASVGLLDYDTARGGFPVRGMPWSTRQDPDDRLRGNAFALPRSQCYGGETGFLPFATRLPNFWPIDAQTAEQQVINRLPPPDMGGRQAFAGIVFSLAPAAEAAGTSSRRSGLVPIRVAIHSVAIYEDPDLERLLYAFPLDVPAPSVLLTGMPQRLPATDQVLLTKEAAALLLLKNQGDVLGADAWNRLAAYQSNDDRAYYDKKDERPVGRVGFTQQRQSFDPDYVPFFPAGFQVGVTGGLTPDQLARFKLWTLARASVLPDRLVLRGEVVRDPRTGGAWLRLGAGGQSGGEATREPSIATLVERGYVPGQVVLPDLSLAELGFDRGTDALNGEQLGRSLAMVLPNLLKTYAPNASLEQIGRAWGLAANEGKQSFDVEVAFDLEHLEVIPIDPAATRPGLAGEVVTLFARPVALRYFYRNGSYAALEQTFEVAALDPHQMTTAAVAAPAPAYAERVPLDAEVADLLIAKYLPDALTEAELQRMLLARWHYETDFNKRAEEPLGGRFFVEGTPRPDARQRAPLLAPFRDWTLARAQTVPTTVTLRVHGNTKKPGPVQLGTSIGGSAVADAARECNSQLGNARRESAGIGSTKALTLEQACRFLEQATGLTAPEIYLGSLQSQGFGLGDSQTNRLLGPRSQCGRPAKGSDVYCNRMQKELEGELLGAEVVLNDVLVTDKEIVVPDDPRINQAQPAKELEVDLRIVGIRRATGLPPHPAAAALEQYQAFAAEHGLPALGRPGRGETPQLRLYLFDAQIVEARVLDARSHELIGTLALRDRPQLDPGMLKVVEPERVAAAPAAYGLDIVGLRLGMSFEDADKLIREHMAVGRLLVADRAYQTTAATGDLKPFSSGRLYVSEDETDTIILFDEPPSAPGMVMGVVRQLNLPKGQVPAAGVFARLREKYGQETHAGNDQLEWGEGTASSGFGRCAPDLRHQGRVDIWRQPDGTPADWRPQGAGSSGFDLPSMEAVGERDALYAQGCQYALGARLDTKGREWDQLIMGLIDKPAYALQFAQSKRLIEQGEAPAEATASSAAFKL